MPRSQEEMMHLLIEYINETLNIIEDKDLSRDEVEFTYVTPVTPGETLYGPILRIERKKEIEREWPREAYQTVRDELSDRSIQDEIEEIVQNPESSRSAFQDLLISRFLSNIMSEYDENMTEKRKAALSQKLISTITNAPVSYDPVVHINGLEISDTTFTLTDDIEIRPIREDDLTRRYASVNNNHPRFNGMVAPSTVVQFEIRTNDRHEVERKRDSILSTLQLYEVVSLCENSLRQNSPLESLGPETFRTYEIRRSDVSHLPYTRELNTSADEDRLELFFNEIRPLVNEKLVTTDEDTVLSIAFERYQNALVDNDSDESRLTSAIMALEALFLKNEGELSDKLSRRVGIILGAEGENEIDVYRKVKQAYQVRSRYVHASKNDEDKQATHDISELAEIILDYTRRSIIVMLQLSGEMDKSDVVGDIRKASLNEDAEESFRSNLEEMVEFRTEGRL